MARKMKAMNESESPTTTPLMAQNIVTSEKVKEILTKDYTEHANNSDSEIIEISNITAKKNKSTLFLIKSYSFNETIKQTTPKQINKFVNKMKSSKARINDKVDDADDDEDYSEILRKPAIIFENGLPPTPPTSTKIKQKSRPKSMPTNISASVTNASVAIVSTPQTSVKRSSASFIRQSLQSIRRSFRTTKKSYESGNGKNVTTPKITTASIVASSASTSSNATTASSTSSAGSTIDFTLVNQVGVDDEEEDAIFYEGVEGENGDIDAAGIVIMLNGIATQMFNEKSMCNGIGTGDPLAVLQEEDDIDLSTKQAQESTQTNKKSFSKTYKRSTSSVGALAYGTSDKCSTALQSHAEAHSVNCLNTLHNSSSPVQKSEKPSKHKRQLSQQLSISGSIQSGNSSTNSSLNENYQNLSPLGSQKSDARSLKQSINTSTTLAPATSSVSVGNISPSLRSNNSSNTAKHEQTTVAATVAAATTSPSEKEKKRKEVSSSRVKKFHRHFTQVPKDEKLINYFSCALVSDILLQGHLYITDQHFAFYSNVFGYVTKVVIPTASVTKISKEKTAKIIPNAVGVATADERHVFASFISRESAFRLMCSVCPPLAPAEVITKTPADIEISEEYSIEDDSSCSVSGNESPPRALADSEAASNAAEEDASQKLLRRTTGSSSFTVGDSSHTAIKGKGRGSDIPQTNGLGHANVGVRASAPPTAPIHTSSASTSTTGVAASAATNLTMIIAGTASSTASTSTSSTPTPSTSSSPTTVMAKPKTSVQFATENFKLLSKKLLINLKMPTEQQLVYLGVFLALVLSLFSIFLLYRILNIEAKTSLYNSPTSFKWRTDNDDDIFTEALRWQKELQHKSTEEAQLILKNNLEQISKVRRSLETLSALIHDRSSAYTNTISNDSD